MTQWLLGLIAGGTIFFGLPIARLRDVTPKVKGFLNAASTGVLIFLLVEITGHLLEEIEGLVEGAAMQGTSLKEAYRYGGLFAAGFALGLLGLVYFERRFLGGVKNESVPPRTRAKQVAMMIAVGLGLHNFSEGLAIGQGYAAGSFQLAWLLAIGFALHNATEGFGIAAPLSGHQVGWGFLGWAGLVAGGPTFLGAVVGGTWVNKPVEIFCLSLASGTILYVVGELLHLGRHLKEEAVVAVGLLVGFFVAVATDVVLVRATTPLAVGTPGAESRLYVAEVGEHGARHGGLFGDANDLYHYELLLDAPAQVRLYVNDERNRPLNTHLLHGRWEMFPGTPEAVSGTLTSSVDGGYFLAPLPKNLPASFPVEVSVQKGQLWAAMEFEVSVPSSTSR